MDPIHVQETGRVEMSCSHEYHLSCIGKWLMHHSTCPLCRRHASEKERLYQLTIPLSDIQLVAQHFQIPQATALRILTECEGDILDAILAYADYYIN